MAPDPDRRDLPALEENRETLELLAQMEPQEIETLQQLASTLTPDRRKLLKGGLGGGLAALLGSSAIGQAGAAASTSDGDGDVGTPSERLDAFLDAASIDDFEVDEDASGNLVWTGPNGNTWTLKTDGTLESPALTTDGVVLEDTGGS